MKKIKDIRNMRRSNKAQILWHLFNKGPLSRLELASLCHLTTPSITQLMQDLLLQGEVVEIGTIQRNATGRREVLVDLNVNKNIALGINIEENFTYFTVANIREVFKTYKVPTKELRTDETIDEADKKIEEILKEFPSVNQICIGIPGKIEDGIIVNGYGAMPTGFNLQKHIEDKFGIRSLIVNNVKAQAMSLYSAKAENYMYVTHSPDIGSAMIIKGEIVKGNDKVTGELGHLIWDINGKPCKCGKRGCINTLICDDMLVENYNKRSGKEITTIDELYSLYGNDEDATKMLDHVNTELAVTIANINELLNPEKIFVTGGIFSQDALFSKGLQVLADCNFNIDVERITDTEKLKATAEAKYMTIKSILDL